MLTFHCPPHLYSIEKLTKDMHALETAAEQVEDMYEGQLKAVEAAKVQLLQELAATRTAADDTARRADYAEQQLETARRELANANARAEQAEARAGRVERAAATAEPGIAADALSSHATAHTASQTAEVNIHTMTDSATV